MSYFIQVPIIAFKINTIKFDKFEIFPKYPEEDQQVLA